METSTQIVDNTIRIFEIEKELEEKEYDEKLVCFLDILGYGNQLSKSQMPKDVALPILILREFEHIVRKNHGHLYISVFSDCLYIVTDKEYAEELLEVVSFISYQLLTDSTHNEKEEYQYHLLRGGITFGKIYEENGLLLGPGMINAYTLETKAFYPRIIVDKSAKEYLDSIEPNVLRKDQGIYFIDYLTFIHCKDHFKDKIPKHSFNHVLQWVEKQCDEYEKLERESSNLKRKYAWVYDYLNGFKNAHNI